MPTREPNGCVRIPSFVPTGGLAFSLFRKLGSHDEKPPTLSHSTPRAAVRRAGGESPLSGGMDDPSISTPRHVRAVDFAAARATEVRARPLPRLVAHARIHRRRRPDDNRARCR